MIYKVFRKITIFTTFILIVLVIGCKHKSTTVEVKDYLLENIKRQGKLVATTNYNSTDYFIYKGTPMGFQLELLEAFTKHLGVKLELIISNDLSTNISQLTSGKCDLIAHNFTITNDRRKIVDFSNPIIQTRQVLVQRIESSDEDSLHKTPFIRNLLDLAGKKVYVQKGSSHIERMLNLEKEIGDSINIIISDTCEEEQMIELVADGTISYSISDEITALVNKKYFNNIDVSTPISFQQNLAWAVRKNSNSLLNELNKWLVEFKQTKDYRRIFDTYYRNPRSVNIVNNEFYTNKKGKLSKYDKEIKKYAKMCNWDWQLLASLIYQESHFDPKLTGWSGAFGMMQMMPATAKKFGVNKGSTPAEQIRGGALLKIYVDHILPKEINNPEERTKFILACYNVGYEHVMDARILARKYKKDPNVWTNNVDFFMKNMSKRKYYEDPLVENGYARGIETYRFVNEVMERYHHYKNIAKK